MLHSSVCTISKRVIKIIGFLGNKRSFCNRSFIFNEEVVKAKRNRQPIVALESTIITHGMPYPDNFNTAIKVEEIIRENGAVPATIGILNGKICIGTDREQLKVLSTVDRVKTLKCSRRDISPILLQKLNGGTTVSATMLLAHMADISIMATGGIGGVHRGVKEVLDISTDLTELGRTPVTVVCSGVKSILDISNTLEYLETQGVPVVKIGETDNFPAFYCAETFDQIKSPFKVSNSREAADLVCIQKELGINTGILMVVPIPEKYALDPNEMELAIQKALEKSRFMSVSGKAITPFLLNELANVTKGQSLEANIELIKHNAKVAAEIAVNLEKTETPKNHTSSVKPEKQPIVIGGAIIDTVFCVKETEIKADGRTYAGEIRQSCGGVARNIGSALIKLGLDGTRFVSVVGDDELGRAIIESLGESSQPVEQLSNVNTPRYTGIINSKGECCFGVADMNAFNSITPELIRKYESQIEEASFIILDGNIPLPTIKLIMDIASHIKIPVWYEPTDIHKASKIFESGSQWQNIVHFISPNKNELLTISDYFGIHSCKNKTTIEVEEIEEITKMIAHYVPIVICTLGAKGVLIARRASEKDAFYDTNGQLIENSPIVTRLYPPLSHISEGSKNIISVIGCGDCFNAGIIYGIHNELNETKCITLGLEAAALSLRSNEAVPSILSTLSVRNK